MPALLSRVLTLRQNNLSGERRVASGLFRGKRLECAAFLAAFGTTHSLGDILEPGIPAAEATECSRLGFALVSALGTLQHQGVLAELIAQFVNMKVGGHAADCHGPMRSRPSSSKVPATLYSANSRAKPMNIVKYRNLPTRPALRLGAVLAALLITGCNNGSGSGGTPITANLEGSVSGLVGSRLVLQNNSTPLTQFNGQGANGTNVLFGTARVNSSYDITVLTQPTTPSQTCVVTNATGTLGSSGVTNIAVSCTINPPRFLYVANRGSGNVSAYTIDAAGGALTTIVGSPFTTGSGPVAIAVDPSGAYVYVANQSGGNISAFTIDRTSGALTAVMGSPFATGPLPTSVAVDPSSSFVYATSRSAGTVWGYAITAGSGALTPLSGGVVATGKAPSAVTVDPLGEFVYVANQSEGTFSAFSINTGLLSADAGSPFLAGSSPSALALDPTGHDIYIANSAANTLTGISGLPVSASVAQSPISGSPYATGLTPISIALSVVNDFVYVANQGSNNVSAYKLGAGTGILTAVPGSPFASAQPAAVAVDPTGRFAYVANAVSNTVSAYAIAPASGALTPLGGSPYAAALQPSAIAISD
jgi:6-phosphogluconolactonase